MLKHTTLESEHEIYRPTRGIEPGSSDRPSRLVRTLSQSHESPRKAAKYDIKIGL